MIKKAKQKGEKFTGQPRGEGAIMVDLLRRTGELDQAIKLAQQTLQKNIDEIIQTVLKFEIYLIKKKDAGCYTVRDAPKAQEH